MMSLASEQRAEIGLGGCFRRPAVDLLIPILAMILVVAVFSVWFMQTERTLYHADQVAYWSYSRSLAQLMRDDPIASVGAVLHTIANDDVNLLPAVPISLMMVVFGGSRLVYLLAIVLIYGFAAAAALIFALARIGPRPPPWVAPLTFGLLATVWQPIYIGYLGIGGVALALVVIGLIWQKGLISQGYRTLMLAGVLLAVLVLFRRWWGIWGLAFIVVLTADALWRFSRSPEKDLRGFWQAVRGLTIVLMSTGLTVVALAAPIVVSRMRTDYSDRFSAYSHEGFSERLASIVGRFGLVGLVVLAGCLAVLLMHPKMRRTGILLAAHLVCTFAIMVRIQDHSPQHWYLYSPQILLIIGLALVQIASQVRRKRKRAFLVALTAVGLVTVVAVFAPAKSGWRKHLTPMLPADVIRPQIRNDLAEVQRLLSYLDQVFAGRTGHLYVLSSSEKLSDHVLGFSNLSMGTSYRSPSEILGASHVDRRDGFPRGLLLADVVLVAHPVQYHLRPEDQRTVGEPAASFLAGTDIALAFTPLPERFVLDDGVTVTVFQRRRHNSREEVAALSDRLRSFYPDRPEIYSPE